jgi:hypothetical protein
MWAVEARNYGEEKDYFYMSGLTEKEARRRHAQMSNSGKWAMCRSWDLVAELEQQQANERIRNFKGKLSV